MLEKVALGLPEERREVDDFLRDGVVWKTHLRLSGARSWRGPECSPFGSTSVIGPGQ